MSITYNQTHRKTIYEEKHNAISPPAREKFLPALLLKARWGKERSVGDAHSDLNPLEGPGPVGDEL